MRLRVYNLQYCSKVSYQSRLVSRKTRVASLETRDVVSRDVTLVSRDENLVSRESLKWKFWNITEFLVRRKQPSFSRTCLLMCLSVPFLKRVPTCSHCKSCVIRNNFVFIQFKVSIRVRDDSFYKNRVFSHFKGFVW